MTVSPLRQWINLAATLKWALLFLLILLYLPLTAYRWAPGSSLLGGLFLELDGWDVFWASVAFFAAAWSLMFTTGLVVDAAEVRWNPAAPPVRRGGPAGGGQIPQTAARFFGMPVTPGQFLLFTLVGAFGAALVTLHSDPGWWAVLPAVAGALVTYVVMILLCLPAHLVEPDYDPVPRSWLAHHLWRLLSSAALAALFRRLRRALSRLLHHLHFRHVLTYGAEGEDPDLRPEHFFALTNFLGLVVILLFCGIAFFPPFDPPVAPPSAAYLYILVTLLIWTLLGIDFHLSRLHISPALVLVAIMFVVYTVDDTDHHYRVQEVAADAAPELDPSQVAASNREPENLVLVTSSGGGILAAGWTALSLEKLILERPVLAHEIRLLSTISGSSVGAAHYAEVMRKVQDAPRLPPPELEETLRRVYDHSTASSLASAAYGFAFLDFWRIFVGGWPPVLRSWDRGRLLEVAWGETAGDEDVTLFDVVPAVRQGRIPSLIMGSTSMETGYRVMLTHLSFPDPTPEDRAQTLSEFLFTGGGASADLTLWTAARMSATFPYVSPAARALVVSRPGGEGRELSRQGSHHLIDGGYYDNYGVTSALDWLEPVLRDRLRGDRDLRFRKVLVVQLNAFAATDPAQGPPQSGPISALVGPLVGLVNIRTGVAVTRNEIDLTRFFDSWNARFADAGVEACLETVELRPPAGQEEPLSWHLTQRQIASQRASWPEDLEAPGEAPAGSIREQWRKMKAFLEADHCPGFPPPAAPPPDA